MHYEKLGLIWNPQDKHIWMKTHATCPTPVLLDAETLRIYFQSRDNKGVGRAGYVDVNPDNPFHILKYSKDPVLDIGRPGAFDDNGVFPTCVIREADSNRLFMYYVGFELCTHIRYRLLTGLAISDNRGENFNKIQETPILERSPEELLFRCGPFVINQKGLYRMWYVAGSEWIDINGKSMPVYDLRHIVSNDGINWPTNGQPCMAISNPDEHGFGRPYIISTPTSYRLFYSIRKSSLGQYRMGYAESADGLVWNRMDNALELDVSPEGWDSTAIEFAAPITIGEKSYLFYNGNDFGRDGIGLAILEGH
jgi:predicted GH43/DUF377 family glycosyl hydrolase